MEKNERISEIRNKSIPYRGEVIERMSWLEKFIDLYITNYFTSKNSFKSQEMQLMIVGDNRISLENKRAIFQKIAEAHDIEWFQAYKPYRKIEQKKGSNLMNKDLVYVIEQRNIFAHCIIDTTDEALENLDGIGFAKFKDKAETIWYNDERYMELANTIATLSEYIHSRNKS